jgi:hypothetical protein
VPVGLLLLLLLLLGLLPFDPVLVALDLQQSVCLLQLQQQRSCLGSGQALQVLASS